MTTCCNIDLATSEEKVGQWNLPFSNINPHHSAAFAIQWLLPSSFHHSIHEIHFNSHIVFVCIFLILRQTEVCVGTLRLTGWLAPPDQWISLLLRQSVQSHRLPDGMCSQTGLMHFLHHQGTAILCRSALICFIITHPVSSVLSLLSSNVLKHA